MASQGDHPGSQGRCGANATLWDEHFAKKPPKPGVQRGAAPQQETEHGWRRSPPAKAITRDELPCWSIAAQGRRGPQGSGVRVAETLNSC